MKNLVILLSIVLLILIPIAFIVGCQQQTEPPPTPLPTSQIEKHFDAGVKLQKQGKLQEAISEYDEATRLEPELAMAYSNRGNSYLNLGQFER